MTDNSNATTATSQGANGSTLIEFPGVNRNRPAWRKELSERFREIQQRRAREAASETEDDKRHPDARPGEQPARAAAPAKAKRSDPSKQLGLVPTPDEPELNPIVAAALRRIERARAQTPTAHARHGAGRGHAAAAARVIEEQTEQLEDQAPALSPELDEDSGAHAKHQPRAAEQAEAQATQARTPGLAVVPPKQPEQVTAAAEATAEAAKPVAEVPRTTTAAAGVKSEERVEAAQAAKPQRQATAARAQKQRDSKQPRHIEGVLDEFYLERHGLDPLPKVAAPELSYDDRAPRAKRVAAALVDLVAVAALSAPFAAGIELTIGDWHDPRVYGSMAGIVAAVVFLYHTCSVALAGRTWGMALCSLRAVDSRTALVPTTGQCARRAFVLLLSLLTFGLGIIYSLFDAEGRTAHDVLSGTVVVRN
jgi:uncharacterized RDD family membrane protein YckC